MGGYNSGRHGGKVRCESCLWIDVRVWARKGLLKDGVSFKSSWSGGSNIRAHTWADRVDLHYAIDGAAVKIHPVRLTYTACHYGGQRAWFRCPYCGSRNAKLFLRAGRFACRVCNRLAYQSQAVDAVQRQHIAYRRVRAKLIDGEIKPKGMHWKTFERLQERIERIDGRLDAAFNLVAGRLFRRLGVAR